MTGYLKTVILWTMPLVLAIPVFQSVVQPVYAPEKQTETPLRQLAEDKLNDLQSTGYWSHTNSDGCNYSCRVERFGVIGWVGENLYYGECDYDIASEMWLDSPTHRYVLLHDYSEQIILYSSMIDGKCYIVYEVRN